MVGIRIESTGKGVSFRRWPWLHWCMFDRQCRSFDCPPRLYFLCLGFFIGIE